MTIEIIKGVNGKDGLTNAFIDALNGISDVCGQCFIGYPLIPTPNGKFVADACLISSKKGVIVFDLQDDIDLDDLEEKQNDIANIVESKLRGYRDLMDKRQLRVPVTVITFVPRMKFNVKSDEVLLANCDNFKEVINKLEYKEFFSYYEKTLSVLESLSNIRKSTTKRIINNSLSKGARLKKLESDIAVLDSNQSKAVIETGNGVQRIRGLAGSGKTIVLALKAAYLHTQNPDWNIAVTFHTRSLKNQFKKLIRTFCIEQGGEYPDWTKLRVLNAWGAGGSEEREGVYHQFCVATGSEFFDFKTANDLVSDQRTPFDYACTEALVNANDKCKLYDAILIDEAQDFSSSFLRLCFLMLKKEKRLVYAYDELQNLSGYSLPSPEEIFGNDSNGKPLVSLREKYQDIILKKCYRNSRPVLVTAHALGFGIYRNRHDGEVTGLVQMFDDPRLWREIGYSVCTGVLSKGCFVSLERQNDSSPEFLENHSSISDLIKFIKFDNNDDQIDWLVSQIDKNLTEDELRYDDIVVIHPDPRTTRSCTAKLRQKLFERGIQNHLAGVDTDADVFFKNDIESITVTGVFRAKGNEAGMVYVINAQECNNRIKGLATVRNQLFTAVTRSKAWVRVLGYGQGMDELKAEYEKVLTNEFRLNFNYPDDNLLDKIRTIYNEQSKLGVDEKNKINSDISEIVTKVQRREISVTDIDPKLLKQLRTLLGR